MNERAMFLDRSVLGQIGRTRRFHLWIPEVAPPGILVPPIELPYDSFKNVSFNLAPFKKISYVEYKYITDHVLSAFENVYPFTEINLPSIYPDSINSDGSNPDDGDELKNRTATAEERSELVLEEAIADKRAQRAVHLSGKICDLFERAYRKDDVRGRVVYWAFAGTCGRGGTRRGTPFAAQTAAGNAVQ
ncbi:unnamed protein product [Lactuca virosa]|uniref:Uncharacterized protein n=1 Tax=Lactuca virosa TaxID=75947 RepID=A0AAU9NKK7_9ASTR|nr:unnamed protein product [Lactuca virosa]